MARYERTVTDVETLIKEFNRATRYVQCIAGELTNEQLLYFYARFKQSTEGPCKSSKPFFFDFQGKAKWEAWHSMEDMSKLDAMKEYIDGITAYDPEWGDKVESETRGFGVGVSTMSSSTDDDETSAEEDNDKTIIDWCKEGNLEQIKTMLANSDEDELNVNSKDDEGLAPLHWACDRGYGDLVQLLLSHRANTEVKDDEGQTPLHYAASCEHVDVVRLLIDAGAKKSAKDVEGMTPADTTQNQEVIKLLSLA